MQKSCVCFHAESCRSTNQTYVHGPEPLFQGVQWQKSSATEENLADPVMALAHHARGLLGE